MLRIIAFLHFLCFCSIPVIGFAQSDCIVSTGSIYGSPASNERAKCLVPTGDGESFYVGGFKDDSALIARITLDGEVEWTRTFEIVSGQTHDINSIFLDSEGMLAVVGTTGGSIPGDAVFIFRYNPLSDQVLWASEILSAEGNESYSVLQKGSGGNYIMSNNPSHISMSNNNSELLEINKNTGAIEFSFAKDYHLGNSEHIVDMVYYQNFLYGVGRYSDGPLNADMRHAVVKINPANGAQVWTKLGHVPGNLNARLYGTDLIIDNNEIYSIYFGDPAGISTSTNKLFIQKSSIDGNLIWVKQYDLPGSSDEAYELIPSGGGYVVLGLRGSAPKQIVLFKINSNGDVLWGKQMQPSATISSSAIERAASQIIELGGYLVFTATGISTNGSADMMIIKTDLDGNVANSCMNAVPVSIPVINVNAPVFYNVTPAEYFVAPGNNGHAADPVESVLVSAEECVVTDTIFTYYEIMICEGENYEGYSQAGIYEDYFVTTDGCDSARTIELTVLAPIISSEQEDICLGESYQGYTESGTYTDTFESMFGCDSIRTLVLDVTALQNSMNVIICEGEVFEGYAVAGFYEDTIQGPPGECDTIRFLNLTVLPPDETTLTISICNGAEYEGYSQTGLYEDIFPGSDDCDSVRILDLVVVDEIVTEDEATICIGESYEGYFEEGFYTDTFTTIQGCDSIRMLTLYMVELTIDEFVTICQGDIYEGYTASGFYVDTIQGELNACDTIRYLDLTVLSPDETNIFISLCNGGAYEGYTQTGTYMDTFIGTDGCDSIRTLDLSVSDEIVTEEEIEICFGQTHEGYLEAGVYIDTFIAGQGCDSIRMLTLTIAANSFTNIDASICNGDEYEGYTVAGQYTDLFTSQTGCDSTRILNLTITDQIITSLQVTICEGEMYEGYTMAGVFTDSFISMFGCDSIRELHLTLENPSVARGATICQGGNYDGYTQPGVYIDTLTGTGSACDTIRQLTVTVLPYIMGNESQIICEGQSYAGYNSTGIYQDTLSTSGGCDSIRILDLIVTNVLLSELMAFICDGQSFEGYSSPGIYIDTFSSTFGCDSIRTLELFLETPATFENIIICSGSTYHGFSVSGFYIDTIPGTGLDCDTINHLDLTVTPPSFSLIEISICEGQSYLGYTTTGFYVDSFLTTQGCDSIRSLSLTVDNEIRNSIDIAICPGEIYEGYTEAGIFVDTFNSVFGCDSIRTLLLRLAAPQKFLENIICEGHAYLGYTQSGSYIDTIQGVGSECDTTLYLELTVLPAPMEQIEKTLCAGQTFEGYSESGIYIDTIQSVSGCDSIRTLQLSMIDPVTSSLVASICNNPETEYHQSGTYIDTLVSVTGCDSIRTLELRGGGVFIPNVFSPNADGINDVFEIYPSPDFTPVIEYFGLFDRFGNMAYEAYQWPVRWEGMGEKNIMHNPGVFAYVLIYHCGNTRIHETGNTTLVR